jgi:hypothetical protein
VSCLDPGWDVGHFEPMRRFLRKRQEPDYTGWLDHVRVNVADARAMGPWAPAAITSDHEHCQGCYEAIGTHGSCYERFVASHAEHHDMKLGLDALGKNSVMYLQAVSKTSRARCPRSRRTT